MCTDYKKNIGTCVKVRNCQKFFTISQKRPIPEDEVLKIRQSYCGSQDGKHYVCCSPEPIEETTEAPKHRNDPVAQEDSITAPAWLTSLQNKLSGVTCAGLQDFVFGGKKTKLDQYPWAALLEYSKRE